MEGSGINPKDLEILPVRLVQAALQKGVTGQDSGNEAYMAADGTTKASKYALKNRKFGKEVISMLNRAASLFVLYIASIAQEQANTKKRATIYDKDISEALKLGLFWEIEREMSEEMQNVYQDMAKKQAILKVDQPPAVEEPFTEEVDAVEVDDEDVTPFGEMDEDTNPVMEEETYEADEVKEEEENTEEVGCANASKAKETSDNVAIVADQSYTTYNGEGGHPNADMEPFNAEEERIYGIFANANTQVETDAMEDSVMDCDPTGQVQETITDIQANMQTQYS